MLISPTTRVADHADPQINEEIFECAKRIMAFYASAGPSAIDRRICKTLPLFLGV